MGRRGWWGIRVLRARLRSAFAFCVCVLRAAFCVCGSASCRVRSAYCVLRSAFWRVRSAYCVLRSAFWRVRSASSLCVLRVRLQCLAYARRDAFADCEAGSLGSLDFATVLGRVNDAFGAAPQSLRGCFAIIDTSSGRRVGKRAAIDWRLRRRRSDVAHLFRGGRDVSGCGCDCEADREARS